MPTPGLSYATHHTPTNASHTTIVSSSFSNATCHGCTSTPTVLTCPILSSLVTNPAPVTTARYLTVYTDLMSPSSDITTNNKLGCFSLNQMHTHAVPAYATTTSTTHLATTLPVSSHSLLGREVDPSIMPTVMSAMQDCVSYLLHQDSFKLDFCV